MVITYEELLKELKETLEKQLKCKTVTAKDKGFNSGVEYCLSVIRRYDSKIKNTIVGNR